MENTIRATRMSLNMTQEELSERCGISRQTLSKIENATGELIVSSKTMLALAKALDTPINELFFED